MQVSFLEVVIPPDFIPEDTSGDLMAPEGSTVKLTCNAKGNTWPDIKYLPLKFKFLISLEMSIKMFKNNIYSSKKIVILVIQTENMEHIIWFFCLRFPDSQDYVETGEWSKYYT